jgi:stage II sporulation protein M
MLELLINPKKAERHPWEMFFVGAFYAGLSVLLVSWLFVNDVVLSKRAGLLIVTFTVMFSIPFVYYTIRLEEKKITPNRGTMALLREHEKAIWVFLWLFLGFIFAFSLSYILFPDSNNFDIQLETYCAINFPSNFENCVHDYQKPQTTGTGHATSQTRLFSIFTNNIYVLMFTLLFSLLFGAGAIFILAWNATVISTAIGIFAQSSLSNFFQSFSRFMIHGLPEIASYFIVALAGGMVSIAVIKHETGTEKFWHVLQDSLNLIIISVVVLFLAALIEVFITPIFF